MSTIKDVQGIAKELGQDFMLFGSDHEKEKEFLRRYHELCDTIKKEFQLTQDQAKRLPNSTELGSEAEQKFQELLEWVKENFEDFD